MDALNAADWTIITVVGVSMILSLLRGFVREALSLLGWLLAFLIAMVFPTDLRSCSRAASTTRQAGT